MRGMAVGLLLALAVAPATHAAEKTLTYQAVMHVVESHAAQVLDNEMHTIGIGEFHGLAIFDDGELATHRYEGWFDIDQGSGRYQGYIIWQFDDGAQIRAQYEGTVRAGGPHDFEVEANMQSFSGTGRFEGVTGSGRFSGRRMETIENGGTTYLKGSLDLSLPQ